MASVVILGGGPGGYEAAHVARQLGADVTVVDSDGIGGSAVLTDCVPSKALIATAGALTAAADAGNVGVLIDGRPPGREHLGVNLATVNARIRAMAEAQSSDIAQRLVNEGAAIISGHARFLDSSTIQVIHSDGVSQEIQADVVLVATGARPRILPGATPDGERILTWDQLYTLTELPPHLIVVGSGVTGAEFASAYRALGSEVTLISSRDRVLPGEDPDAARVIEDVFARRGIRVLNRSRAVQATRTDTGVSVTLDNGNVVHGSHVLMAVGSVPNTDELDCESAGIDLDDRGFIEVDRVSRTSVRGIYAAGDVTGVLMLASVAAMQGRIAMWHALGDAVTPLDPHNVSSTVFTDPEIATVGATQLDVESDDLRGDIYLLPLATNARAKMEEHADGFIKIICRKSSRIIAGAVVVGPHASELVHSLTIAVEQRMTVDELASVFTVYPSLSGSIAETARRLHVAQDQ